MLTPASYILIISWWFPLPQLSMASLEQCRTYGHAFEITHPAPESSYFCADIDLIGENK